MMSHEETLKKEKIYFELVTRLGSEMLENGGEIFRTGDVMTYAAHALGLKDFNTFVIANGIFASMLTDGQTYSCRVRYISLSPINICRLEALNTLSRRIVAGLKDTKEIEAELKKVQEQNAREITVDRPAENGDTVVIDFEGSVDGEVFEGGTAENHPLVLGSGSFIPGFEDQLVGATADSDVEVNVTFPEDYQAKDLAGKAAVFKVKVHEIKKKELPEINDEFAQDVSEFDTLDEYKEDVKKGIAEQKEKAVRQEKQEKIIRQIVENAEMDIPDPMVVTQTRQMMDQFAQQMQSNGLSMAQYYQFTGLTPDGLLEQMKPQAQKNIENRLVLEAIAAAEGITASEEEVEKEFANIAERYGLTVDKVKEIFADEETENIKSDIAAQKALDMITEAAVEVPVTEVEATVEDAE